MDVKVVYALALGKVSSSPFSRNLVVACRSSLESALKAGGIDVVQNETDAPEAIRVRWLQAVALGVDDPDAHFASMVAGGVRTGALSSLPRTLPIFEKKSKWALPEECIDSWDRERWRDNYVSIRKQFEEEKRRPHDHGLSQEGPRRVARAWLRGRGREKRQGRRVASCLRRDPRRPCELKDSGAGPDTLPSLAGFGGALGRDDWRRDGCALLG